MYDVGVVPAKQYYFFTVTILFGLMHELWKKTTCTSDLNKSLHPNANWTLCTVIYVKHSMDNVNFDIRL